MSTYLAPISKFELLVRPTTSGNISSIYTTLVGSSEDVLKLCQECQTKVQTEHSVWTTACGLLCSLRCLSSTVVRRTVVMCLRAFYANLTTPTPLSLVGQAVHQTLTAGFYQPKLRIGLETFDKQINTLVTRLIRDFLTRTIETSGDLTFVQLDSVLQTSPTHRYSKYPVQTFLSCLLNTSNVGTMREDVLTYIIGTPERCMQFLLSTRVLGYSLQIYNDMQARCWTSLCLKFPNLMGAVEYLVGYPYMLEAITKSIHTVPDEFASFVKVVSTAHLPSGNSIKLRRVARHNKNAKLQLLCNSIHVPLLFRALAHKLGLETERSISVLNQVHSILGMLVHDTEQFQTTVSASFPAVTPGPFEGLIPVTIQLQILEKVYSNEPKIVPATHVLSDGANHVARIFHSWMIFPEPHGVWWSLTRNVLRLVQAISPTNPTTTVVPGLFNGLVKIRHSEDKLEVGCVPVHGSPETTIRLIGQDVFDSPPEIDIHVFMLVFLMRHLGSFIEFPETSGDLKLVETTTTTRNSMVILAPLTFAGLVGIQTHGLPKSLNATTVNKLESIIKNLVQNNLPCLWIGLLELVQHGTTTLDVVTKYMQSLEDMVRQQIVRDQILEYLV